MKRARLAGSVALVTGGASGIGLACVKRLRKEGARVVVADRDARALGRLSRTIPREDLHAVDVADAEAVRGVVLKVVLRHGHVDVAVLCAGITRDAVLWKMTDAAWRDVVDVNLTGPATVLRALAPHLRANGGGRIVLVSSINARRGKFGQANYAASKAGLTGLARTAARELGPSGVTVNVVEPGFTETPMTAALPAEIRAKAVGETPLGRTALPDDVAGAVLFFLGPDAGHVTGQALAVDGGQGMG